MRAKLVATTTIAAGALAVAGVGTGIAATAPAKPHTITFTSHTLSQRQVGRRAFIDVDRATTGGKFVGNDVIHGKENLKTGVATADVAAAFAGGIIYGTFNVTREGVVTAGKVTGGTEKFAGATGTITDVPKRKGDKITITYK
jgi:hypothetical protein